MKTISLLVVSMLVVGLCSVPLQAHAVLSSTTPKATVSPVYTDQLDQKQEVMTPNSFIPIGHLPIVELPYNIQVAQSFIPTKALLTRVQLELAKNASTTLPLTVAIRQVLSGSNLAQIVVPAAQIPTSNFSWVEFNLPDSWVVPGTTYYIVCTTENVTNNWYGWCANNDSDSYPNGCAWYSLDGINWNSTPESEPNLQGVSPQTQPRPIGDGTWDTCFRTYGLPEASLTCTVNMHGLTITNAGNVTAQDLWWNITIVGGIFGLINVHTNGTMADLAPGNSTAIKLGSVFGLGAVTITIQVGGANVKTIEISKIATVIFFFIVGLK